MGLFFVALCAWMGAIQLPATAGTMTKDDLVLVASGKEHIINIEIAQTDQQKSLGLMFRKSLGRRAGMLFAYDKPQELTMWMRNTYISLDMVFIKAGGIVHRIEENTEPFSERVIASQGNVVAVLELAAGVARELSLKPGDSVRHPAIASPRP